MEESDLIVGDSVNTLDYCLYLSKEPDDSLIEQYQKNVKNITNGEIENLDLEKKGQYKLQGNLKFSNNIEDEWLTIFSLFELSKLDKDLVITVKDNDGEILLIEAGDHLPAWLESSKSKNRTFVHNGNIHIIPENIDLKKLANYYNDVNSERVELVARFVRDKNRSINQIEKQYNSEDGLYSSQVNTVASKDIQEAVQQQFIGLPDKQLWLTRKFKNLDDIICEKDVEDKELLQDRFNQSLTLASVCQGSDDYFDTSSISPASSWSSLSAHNT